MQRSGWQGDFRQDHAALEAAQHVERYQPRNKFSASDLLPSSMSRCFFQIEKGPSCCWRRSMNFAGGRRRQVCQVVCRGIPQSCFQRSTDGMFCQHRGTSLGTTANRSALPIRGPPFPQVVRQWPLEGAAPISCHACAQEYKLRCGNAATRARSLWVHHWQKGRRKKRPRPMQIPVQSRTRGAQIPAERRLSVSHEQRTRSAAAQSARIRTIGCARGYGKNIQFVRYPVYTLQLVIKARHRT